MVGRNGAVHWRCLALFAWAGAGWVACGGSSSVADTADAIDTSSDATDTTADTATDVEGDSRDGGDTTADGAETWTAPTYAFGTCGSTTPANYAGCVEVAHLEATVRTIVGPRAVGDAKWQVARDLCHDTLSDLGFTVTLQPTPNGTNVIGTRLGTDKASELVVVGAHYDGVPGCDAADDNGSGVAGVLEVARVLAGLDARRTLVVTCWDEEELGLIGSRVQAEALYGQSANVVLAVSFEMIGFTDARPGSQSLPLGFGALFPDAQRALDALGGRGVFITLIGGDDAAGPRAALAEAANAIGLPTIEVELSEVMRGSPFFADLRRSDHASFWDFGYPAIQLTDTANFRNPHYHCGDGADAVDTLDFAFMHAVTAMSAVAIAHVLTVDDAGVDPKPRVAACDVVAQDCGEGKRCVATLAGDADTRACIAAAASPVGAGEVCVRPNGVLGEDTCAVGYDCTLYGGVRTGGTNAAPTYDRVCSRYCDPRGGCEDGACIAITSTGGPNLTGVCRPTCDLFGDTCGAGQVCALRRSVAGAITRPVCTPKGTTALGQPCSSSGDCQSGACAPKRDVPTEAICVAYCDASRACGEGLACVPQPSADIGAGVAPGVCLP